MKAESKVDRLERKVDAMSKALRLILHEEPEALSEEEAKLVREAHDDWVHGRKDKFVPLDEL